MLSREDLIWGLCQENLQYCRHHENQRQAITGFALVIASALIGFIVADKQLNLWDAPVASLVILVGLFGALLSSKEYERFAFHYERFRELRRELAGLVNLDVVTLSGRADAAHRASFSWLFERSLSRFWLGTHLIIAAIGMILLVGALACSLRGPCLNAAS